MMDIALLPDHIVIEIAKFLTADDLYSCSLVNAAWRDSVNQNEIWRYMCKINVVSCKELDHVNSFHGTNSSSYSTSNLNPLCEWRRRFMKWEKLKQNWEKGVYKHYVIDEQFSIFSNIECDDDRVMVVHHSVRKLSVWCIKQEPYFLEVIHFCLAHVCADFVKLCNNLLVVVQCNLLQVFRNAGNEFKLSFRSMFNKQNFDLLQLPNEFDISDWYQANINIYPCDIVLRCDHNGEKFVGIILDGDCDSVVLHIWDLNIMTKDAEEVISNVSFCVDDVNLSISENYLYILLKSFRSDQRCSLHVYDLKLLTFLDFNLCYASSSCAFVAHKDSLFILSELRNYVHVWKVLEKTEKTMSFNFKIDTKCFKIMNSHLLISGYVEKLVSIVSVYRLSDLRQVFNIRVNDSVTFISMIHYKFLVINTTGNVSVRVYDIPKQCFLYFIPVHECLYFNSINSKILTRVKNKLNLVSFLN